MHTIQDDWPPIVCKDRCFTNLALIRADSSTNEYDYIYGNIDSIIAMKEQIELDEVFLPIIDPDTKECQLTILMDGAPGVGKTTISRKLCIDWARGKMLQEYQLVILIELRRSNLNEESDIAELFSSESKDLSREVAQYFTTNTENLGKRVLFIFDGYDEVYISSQFEQSLFSKVLRRDRLQDCSLLITTRPYASESVKTLGVSINRHIEVLGFSSQLVRDYIQSNLLNTEAVSKLVNLLSDRQDIFSLCYIPLNCRIVLFVYEKLKFELPATLTELFEVFILHTIKHHLDSKSNLTRDKYAIRRANCIANLPEWLPPLFDCLSALAYKGIVNGKVDFGEEELQSEDLLSLGLLTAHCSITDTSIQQIFQFLHLTIQEFLAAKHLALSPPENQIKFVRDHISNRRFQMTIIFLAGLTKLKCLPSYEPLIDIEKLNDIQAISTFNASDDLASGSNKYDSVEQTLFILLAHMVYESQTSSTSQLIRLRSNKLDFSSKSLSSFEALVVSHFLSATPEDFEWDEINLVNCSFPILLEKKHLLNSTRYSVGMTKVLHVGPVDPKFVLPVLSQGLLELHLYSMKFDHSTFSVVCEAVGKANSLNKVVIVDSPHTLTDLSRHWIVVHTDLPLCSYCFMCLLSFSNVEKLESIICSSQARILHDCSNCNHQGAKTIEKFNFSLSKSQRLRSLDLSNCNLTTEVVDSIASALFRNNAIYLEEIDVNNNKLTSLKQLSSLLAKCVSLKACGFHFQSSNNLLTVTDCSSAYKDLKVLAKTLCVPEYFNSLEIDMSNKDICRIPSCYIAWLLNNNQNLQKFHLHSFHTIYYYESSCKDTLQLAQAISTHRCLQSLSLPQLTATRESLTIFGNEEEDSLTRMCTDSLNKILEYFTDQVQRVSIQNLANVFQDCNLCRTNADLTVQKFCKWISKSDQLKALNFSNCLLTEEETKIIVAAIPPSICHIDLTGNTVGSSSVNELLFLMKYSLSVLNIDGFALQVHDRCTLTIKFCESAESGSVSQCYTLLKSLKTHCGIKRIKLEHHKDLSLVDVVNPLLANNPHLAAVVLQTVMVTDEHTSCEKLTAIAESLLKHKSIQSLRFNTDDSNRQNLIVIAKDTLHIHGLKLCPLPFLKLLQFLDYKAVKSIDLSNQQKAFQTCLSCERKKDKLLNDIFKDLAQNKELKCLVSKSVDIDLNDEHKAFQWCVSSRSSADKVLRAFLEVCGNPDLKLPTNQYKKSFQSYMSCDCPNDDVLDAFLEVFDHSDSLEYLNISDCQLSPDAVERLACRLHSKPELQILFMQNNCINLPAFKFLLKLLSCHVFQEMKMTDANLFFNTKHEELCYSSNSSTDNFQLLASFIEGILTFSFQQKAVRICAAEFNDIHAVPLKKLLCNESGVTSLRLTDCQLTSAFFDIFSMDNKATVTLKELHMHSIKFVDCSIMQLFDLFNFSGLEVFSLYTDPEDQTNDADIVKLLRTISENLKLFDLRGWYMDHSVFSIFSEVLSLSTTLQTLDLSGCYTKLNNLNDWENTEDSKEVGKNLRLILTNPSIRTLNLATLTFDETVMSLFASGLTTNTTLQTLILDSLCLPFSLTTDILDYNECLTSQIWIILFESLEQNSSLYTLSVCDNSIGKDGFLALKSLLEWNTLITTLKVRDCDITVHDDSNLKELTVKHPHLQFIY